MSTVGIGVVKSNDIDGDLVASVSGQTVRVTRFGGGTTLQPGPLGVTDLRLSNVRLPFAPGLTGNFAIRSFTASGAAIDELTTVAGITIDNGALSDGDVISTDRTAGALTSVTVNFINSNPIPTNGRIVVFFPAKYDLTNLGITATSTSVEGDLDVTRVGQRVTIQRQGTFEVLPLTPVDDLRLTGVRNPLISGAYVFRIETREVDSSLIDETGEFELQTPILPGVLRSATMIVDEPIVGTSAWQRTDTCRGGDDRRAQTSRHRGRLVDKVDTDPGEGRVGAGRAAARRAAARRAAARRAGNALEQQAAGCRKRDWCVNGARVQGTSAGTPNGDPRHTTRTRTSAVGS